MALVVLVGAAHIGGWWRLSRRVPDAIPLWRVGLGGVALATIVAALVSPLDRLAHDLFSAHMAQHMLLTMVAAPALLLANPLPIVLWALPARGRARVGRWLTPSTRLRRSWRAAVAMPVAWLAYALVLWAWHLPVAYDAALADPLVHALEHFTLFASAVLFWWPVVNPAPRLRPSPAYGARVVYVVLAAVQSSALGLLLSASPTLLYRSYERSPLAQGWSPLADQAWGGVIMWTTAGAVEMLAALLLVYRSLGAGEHEPARTRAALAARPRRS